MSYIPTKTIVYVDTNLLSWDASQISNVVTGMPHHVILKEFPNATWMKENITGDYLGVFYSVRSNVKFYFVNGIDAMAFKLIYG